MKKRIYLVLETEADEDDKSILSDIEQELGMATHYFEIAYYSENGFPDKWISVKNKLPNAEYGESKDVLTINSMGVMRVMNFDGGCWCYPTMEPYASAFKITHWMPLPELSKEV